MESAPRHPVPVFPLPSTVMFPHTVQSLHVFELRYRTLVRDALSAGRTLALALLMPGWEHEYHGSPEFHPLGCLASIAQVEWLPNDRYQIVLEGTARVRIGRAVREYPYRACRVEILPQEPLTEDDPLVQIQKRAVIETHERFLAAVNPAAPATVDPAAPYEAQVNALCAGGPASPVEKLSLLSLDSVIERGQRVRELTETWLRRPAEAEPEAEGGAWN